MEDVTVAYKKMKKKQEGVKNKSTGKGGVRGEEMISFVEAVCRKEVKVYDEVVEMFETRLEAARKNRKSCCRQKN